MFYHPQVLPGWILQQAKAEDFLQLFISKVHLKRLYGNEEPPYSAEQILQKPPQHNLLGDCGFWKTLAAYTVIRLQPSEISGETRRSIKSAWAEFQLITTAFKRLTGIGVDPSLLQECAGLIETQATAFERPKPIATFANVVSFIKDGVFGDQFVLRCPREQVQIAAIHLIMVFCAVRPSEVIGGRLKQAALRYGDLSFYLSLWTSEDTEDDLVSRITHKDALSAPTDRASAPSTFHTAHLGQPQEKPTFQLHCDIHFRKLKGSRRCSVKWRDQPLYAHGEEACLDPTILLAHLAEVDGVFPPGLSIPTILKDADPSYFSTHDFLAIPIRPEARDLFVFRAIECKREEGRLPIWSALDTKPLNTGGANKPMQKAARAAGLLDHTPYALRRLTLNALDRPDLPEGARNMAIGHGMSSRCLQKSYLAKRSTIDIQGVVMKGMEQRAQIVGHGLRQLPVGSLSHSNDSSSSRLAASRKVDSLPTVQTQVRNVEAARAAYTAALSSEHTDEDDLLQLQLQTTTALRRLAVVRRCLLEKELDDFVIEAEERNQLSALLGSGPVDTAQELNRQLSAESLDTSPHHSTDSEEDSDTSSDDQDSDCIGGEAQSSEGWQECGAILDAMATLSQDEDLRFSPSPALASPPLASLSPASPPLASLSPTSPPPALQLHHAMEELCSRFTTAIPLPTPNYDILKQSPCPTDLSDVFAALSSSNKGTHNAIAEHTMETTNGACPWCGKSWTDAVKQRHARGLKHAACLSFKYVNLHLQTCTREAARAAYGEACRLLLAGKPCIYAKCAIDKVPSDPDEFNRHLEHHHTQIIKSLHTHRSTWRCPLSLDGGDCSWSLPAAAESDFVQAEVWLHFETDHCWPTVNDTAVQLCATHNRWYFGASQISEHCRSDTERALRDPNLDFANEGLCPW